ncbi:MAG: glycerol-3-phosphate dehydrogenase/oxidase [Cyclobacteriaceae bacterium]|nr:glycerol-3-phosphate dehydrogenase/oxidase [Cyclobacteriaceae bacterium]
MIRTTMISNLESREQAWDVLIIGGGATGLGTAVDAASRGYATILLEQHDFAKATSSRSTKLIHGGVKYLEQGQFSLAFESMRERFNMLQNAPHIVQDLSFVIPAYDWWDNPYYSLGLKLYDMVAGKLGMGASRSLNYEETLAALPTLRHTSLRSGVRFTDGQFDDARMSVSLAQTAHREGAVLLNYCKVTALLRKGELISGVMATDQLSGKSYRINARIVINATGVFCDDINRMDNDKSRPLLKPSKGVHLILDKSFLPGGNALLIPKTEDGKIFYAVPWYNRVLIGTTDTQLSGAGLEPRPTQAEIENILTLAGKYLTVQPRIEDIKSHYAGLRPLLAPTREGNTTKEIARGHTIFVSASGLLTISGGRWATYRQMAEDVVDRAAMLANLPQVKCRTSSLKIYGGENGAHKTEGMYWYGSEWPKIQSLMQAEPEWAELLSPHLPYTKAAVYWAVKHEMAQSIEDVLARRTRTLFLDASEAIRIAPEVANLMKRLLGKDDHWVRTQLDEFTGLARNYTLT